MHGKKYLSSNQIFCYSLRFKVSGDELCQTWKLTLEKSMFEDKKVLIRGDASADAGYSHLFLWDKSLWDFLTILYWFHMVPSRYLVEVDEMQKSLNLP